MIYCQSWMDDLWFLPSVNKTTPDGGWEPFVEVLLSLSQNGDECFQNHDSDIDGRL